MFLQEQIKDIIIHNNTSEGVPGVGVAQTVDVSVKKNLVRAHVVGLQDVAKSVVGLVEAKVTPVVTDRSSSCRKGSKRATCTAG